jgi:hypothetical protein
LKIVYLTAGLIIIAAFPLFLLKIAVWFADKNDKNEKTNR